jgi:methionyl-tRNA synthetase
VPSATDRRLVIIAPTPTPNGDLHVGHLSGPYLSADVFARYARATGRSVVFTTTTDDAQSYVLTTATKLGLTPQELADRSHAEIQRTLRAAGVAMDGFAPIDDGYRETVLDFVTALHRAGKFRTKTVRLPYSEKTGEFLVEGMVGGFCPVCLLASRGGLCETCGHPNNCDELLEPHSVFDPDDVVTHREVDILVLPLEEYREQLTAHYRAREDRWRPHLVQVFRELLAKPLPDYPVTYPIGWGTPAPFPETPGQVLNPWVEAMPASMYTTAHSQRQLGEEPSSVDELWLAERNSEVVYFHGFDNAYFWGLTDFALLLAHDGRYVGPDTLVCNEFYELEHEKFSTSKGHLIWARDLVAEVPRDLVRFYLTLTGPENSRTNFTRADLDRITADRLVGPWNRLAVGLDKAVAALGASAEPLPVSAAARQRAAVLTERFAGCYDLRHISLNRAAENIANQAARLADAVEARFAGPDADAQAGPDRDRALAALGELFTEVRALIAGAAPILVDVAEAAARSGGYHGRFHTGGPEESGVDGAGVTRAFPVPPIGGAVCT